MYSSQGDWSSGMIPASGAGGRGFDSPITPYIFAVNREVRNNLDKAAPSERSNLNLMYLRL